MLASVIQRSGLQKGPVVHLKPQGLHLRFLDSWAAAGGESPWREQFLATPQPASFSSHTVLGAPDTDIQGEKGVLAGSSGLTLRSGHQGHLQQHRRRDWRLWSGGRREGRVGEIKRDYIF